MRTIFIYLLNYYYKLTNKKSIIESNLNLYKSKLGKYTRICNNSVFKRSTLDEFSYIGENCFFDNIKIGKFTSIAKNTALISGQHPSSKFVSSHPVFYSTRKQVGITFVDKQKFDDFKFIDGYSIVIGNDVWIGESVKILEGVKIGDGAIIASGSIVTKDIEPFTINGGVPSKIIKERFNKEYKDWLIEFKWWDKDIEWLKKEANNFDDVEKLYKKYRLENKHE